MFSLHFFGQSQYDRSFLPPRAKHQSSAVGGELFLFLFLTLALGGQSKTFHHRNRNGCDKKITGSIFPNGLLAPTKRVLQGKISPTRILCQWCCSPRRYEFRWLLVFQGSVGTGDEALRLSNHKNDDPVPSMSYFKPSQCRQDERILAPASCLPTCNHPKSYPNISWYVRGGEGEKETKNGHHLKSTNISVFSSSSSSFRWF